MIVAVVKVATGRHRVEIGEPARVVYSTATSHAAETVAAFVRSLHEDVQRAIWERGA